jgi:hypothetical protein
LCCAEEQFDELCSGDHRGVERAEQREHHPSAIILLVDVQCGQDQEVGIDEGDDPSEAEVALCSRRIMGSIRTTPSSWLPPSR